MNEVMVGELSEFAEGGYGVLRSTPSSSESSGKATAWWPDENHCPHDGWPGLVRVRSIRASRRSSRPTKTEPRPAVSGRRTSSVLARWLRHRSAATAATEVSPAPVDVRVRDNRVYVVRTGRNRIGSLHPHAEERIAVSEHIRLRDGCDQRLQARHDTSQRLLPTRGVVVPTGT